MIGEDIEEFEEQINGELNSIQQEIDSIRKKDSTQKQNQFTKIHKMISNLETLIKAYEIQITSLDRTTQNSYQHNFKQIQSKYKKLKTSYEQKKQEEMNADQLFSKGIKGDNLQDLNSQELMQIGDKYMKMGNDGLTNAMKIINQEQDMANNIQLEIDKQIEQLDRMHDVLMETASTLNRTDRIIRYFLRNIYTDKILMCLIGLIGVVIVVLIALNAMGYNQGSFAKKDQVTTTTTK